MSGYNPSVPIGQPYGMSGPASLPGSGPSSPLNSGPQSPFSSGGVGSSPFSSAQQSQLQNALSAAGIWDTITGIGGDIWGGIAKILPKNKDGSIDWGGALKDVGSWVKDNKDTILQGLTAYDNYQRSQKSDQYAKDALAGAKESYDAKAPLRTAGQAGMLDPHGPDISALRTQGQNGLNVKAPTPLPLATPNLANAQHLANGPGSSNPFTKTLPIAPPSAPPSLPPAQGSTPVAPPTLPIAQTPATPAVPGTAPTPGQLEGPHLPAPFSPTPPGFGQRKPGQMIRPLPLATY